MLTISGDSAKAKNRLPGFLRPLERHPDIPILKKAKAEYAKLK